MAPGEFLDGIGVTIPGTIRAKVGRSLAGVHVQTGAFRQKKYKARKRRDRLKYIAVLDMETDPFNPNSSDDIVPFVAELYSDQFGSIVIWEDDFETLIDKLYAAIESLPESYTIYCHNGGKFDFMFLVRKLRGIVKFKGRAIMSAKIGAHELRDSLHILPEKLSAWKKDKFDYRKMLKSRRHKHREEILSYLHSDCVYLFEFVRKFIAEFGLKISIGQAAFSELRKHYKTPQIKETMDLALRPYFFGGRVECIAGRGVFEARSHEKPYKLYDVNSMYNSVMADRKHPISGEYVWRRGEPGPDTFFIDLNCRSYGAFVCRADPNAPQSDADSLDDCSGRFYTTIWEYNIARKYDLIEDVKFNWIIDNRDSTAFDKFVLPLYQRRQQTKSLLKQLRGSGHGEGPSMSAEFEEIKKEDLFIKYLQNNAYGKFAQNPRRFREYCYTDHGQRPDKLVADWFAFMQGADDATRHAYAMPVERTEQFDVWARPSPSFRFNNVGTGASITGAARSVLLEAKCNAVDAIYCDTDSLICRELRGVPIDDTALGAWKLEETFDAVIITGKKTYCCKVAGKPDGHEGRLKVRSKGVDLRCRPQDRDGFDLVEATAEQWAGANTRTWQRYLDILDGQTINVRNAAPTMNKTGHQQFMTRRIRNTAPLKSRQFASNGSRSYAARRA